MSIKNQLAKIKENWLIIVAVLVLFLFLGTGGSGVMQKLSYSMDSMGGYSESEMYSKTAAYYPPSNGGDFAPEVEERKITKTASLSTEVKRGEFKQAETMLKEVVSSSDAILLSDNSNKYGTKKKSYYQGSYQIKVDNEKYDAFVSLLKGIGEVQRFSENTQDITGQYTNTALNLEIEKERLERYRAIYKEAEEIKDKIEVENIIFYQEKRVKYLEDSLKNLDRKIDYSTVTVSIKEKESNYANVVFVKCSELVKNLVNSVNALLHFLSAVLPWAVLALIGGLIWKRVRKKKK